MSTQPRLQRARRRTWSQFGDLQRVPTEYEIVTHKLYPHFRRAPAPFEIDPNAPINQWYLKYREGSSLQADNWEDFRDNNQLTYRSNIKLQDERETYLDGLIDQFESQNSDASLSAEWVNVLERLYIPARYATHVLQMIALYIGQMAPSAHISNVAHFQAGDECRRLQRSAYRAKALSMVHHPDLASSQKTRHIWEHDPVWQPMRELLEKLLIAYDWGEAFVGLNLVVKPLYDELMLNQLSQLAQLNHDRLLVYMNSSFVLDSQRSQDWTQALIKYAVQQRSENQEVIQTWVKKWQLLGFDAVTALTEVFSTAPNPINPSVVSESVFASYQNTIDR